MPLMLRLHQSMMLDDIVTNHRKIYYIKKNEKRIKTVGGEKRRYGGCRAAMRCRDKEELKQAEVPVGWEGLQRGGGGPVWGGTFCLSGISAVSGSGERPLAVMQNSGRSSVCASLPPASRGTQPAPGCVRACVCVCLFGRPPL